MLSCDDITIIVQDDADLAFSQCETAGYIHISNATGTLSLFNVSRASTIEVRDSPQLNVLDFPDLIFMGNLTISQATSLTRVSLPEFGTESALTITGAPALQTLNMKNLSQLRSLTLLDVGDSLSPIVSFAPEHISYTDLIETDRCLTLQGLLNAGYLNISAVYHCLYDLWNLMTVYDFTLTNAAGVATVDPPDPELVLPGLHIKQNMFLESSGYGLLSSSEISEISVRRIEFIDQSLNISSNKYVHIAYDRLTRVGNILSIRNNTSCTFNFENLSEIGTLSFTDNVNTTLPSFTNLEKAENIHIQGLIDPLRPNIFPGLRLVSGNVTVDPLDVSFDCSKLMSQWKDDHIIKNLQCYGANNGTELPPSTSNSTTNSTPSQNLSEGAWVGIGLGIGAVSIGILGALIWLAIHYRTRLRTLESAGAQTSDVSTSPEKTEQPEISQAQEDVFVNRPGHLSAKHETGSSICQMRQLKDSLGDFTLNFGGEEGAYITAPMGLFVIPLEEPITKETGEQLCGFTVANATESSSFSIGAVFWRAAYIVADPFNNKIALAQANYDDVADETIVVPFSGLSSAIPSAVDAPNQENPTRWSTLPQWQTATTTVPSVGTVAYAAVAGFNLTGNRADNT
ncbi:hypothetical protein F4802DRAFT_618799 [Xylaria palmicola]|nr:hypothetical protein F4802DRAFT_618799 [Xylaria palmicola]